MLHEERGSKCMSLGLHTYRIENIVKNFAFCFNVLQLFSTSATG